MISKIVRSRRTRIIFQELRRMVKTIQSRVRGTLVRSRIKFMIKQKLDLYTTQIFVLWTYLHIPLIYRTKLWPDISSDKSFLCLRIAESELERLWDVASLPICSKGSRYSDNISLYCNSIGISNKTYLKSKECTDWLKGNMSMISNYDDALRNEEAERLQIYERLSISIFEKDISNLYRTFNIAPDEKMKKVALSQKVWTNIVLADRSVTSMIFIFPELKNTPGISVLNPSSKGKRRFPKALMQPFPTIDHELWEAISIEGRTKRHVHEVAMLFITKVPEISKKLDSIRSSRDTDSGSFFQAAAEAKGLQSIKQARRLIINLYIHSNC